MLYNIANYMTRHRCSVPSDMTAWLGQLKDSLSQLLIMAIDTSHLAAHTNPSPCRSQETFDQFAMPL